MKFPHIVKVFVLLTVLVAACSSLPPQATGEPGTSTLPILPPANAVSTTTPTFVSLLSTAVPSSTSSLTPASTPKPTLTGEQITSYMQEILTTNNQCPLPCFWGMTPGQTTWSEAERFFTHTDANIFPENSTENAGYEVAYELPDIPIFLRLGVYTSQNIITRVNVSLGGFNRNPITVAPYYSLKRMFSEYGLPSHILIHLAAGGEIMPDTTGYEIEVFYVPQGFSIAYRGAAKKMNATTYQVCYSDALVEDEFAGVELTLASPSDDVFERILSAKEAPNSYYYPIDKAFGVSMGDFYRRVIQSNEPYCFTTPHELWP